ncbi:MAG: PilZ domain-containing protein [Myxococcales bacterium]|nr:PilZ domain-containing protein [Myxococcales bacterium]
MAEVLVIHDGELADVREILAELDASFTERVGPSTADDQATPWSVIVGSPRRVMEMQVGASGAKPVRIALMDGDSKTLVAMLRRSGVDLMVQRPVHPSALRLLLLHAFYRGPEKRKYPRYTIGAPARFRAGLAMKRPALLADLSMKGCRLIAKDAPQREQTLKVFFGTELGARRAFAIRATVVRCGPTEGAGDGMNAIALRFDDLGRDEARGLKEVIAAHLNGPAMLERAEAAKHAVTRAAAHARTSAAPPSVAASPIDAASVAAPDDSPAAADPAASADANDERRAEARRSLDRRVIALGVEATRVLMGRDISVGGMRVERNDTIDVGDDLRIALHVRARSEPLVVQARVERDDGEDGLLLRFHDLTETAENYLRKMVNFLPILAARGGDEGSGIVVSEILDRGASAATSALASLPTATA